MRNVVYVILGASICMFTIGCTKAPARGQSEKQVVERSCIEHSVFGRFDTAKDLLIANYDLKPDVDDVHSAAAFATILSHPDFHCVNYFAVSGTTGNQGGKYIDASKLFEISFGAYWLNANAARDEAVFVLTAASLDTLRNGGKVWIAEGGQSDFTADLVSELERSGEVLDLKTGITVVQHSDWNEQQTSQEKLAYVKEKVSYQKIADGNEFGNGTPDYENEDSSEWSRLTQEAEIGQVWYLARLIANKHNGRSGYLNPAIAGGGLDFSDTVEVTYILGLDDLDTPSRFFDRLLMVSE